MAKRTPWLCRDFDNIRRGTFEKFRIPGLTPSTEWWPIIEILHRKSVDRIHTYRTIAD